MRIWNHLVSKIGSFLGDTGKGVLGILGLVLFVVCILFLCTVPFAFIGWALIQIVQLFGSTLDPGYWELASGGLGIIIAVAILHYLVYGNNG